MFSLLTIIIPLTLFGLLAKYFTTDNSDNTQKELELEIAANPLDSRQWWAKKRLIYNLGLIIAGGVAFIAYATLGEVLIAPYDINFEVTIFTIFFQGVGYIFMVLIANLFYNLGPYVDRLYNTGNSEAFRRRLFQSGFWFSVGLPFLIPALIVVEYFLHFSGHKQ